MMRSHLATIISELPLARRLLAPLREVRSRYGWPGHLQQPALSLTLLEATALFDGGVDEGFAPLVEMLRGQAWAFRL